MESIRQQQLNLLNEQKERQGQLNQKVSDAFQNITDLITANMIKKSLREDDARRSKKFQELNIDLNSKKGELVNCDRCHGNGTAKCDYCDGNGNKKCSLCNGKGTYMNNQCKNCDGTGKSICLQCNGSGNRFCFGCDGTGKIFKRDYSSNNYVSNADNETSNSPQNNNTPANLNNNEPAYENMDPNDLNNLAIDYWNGQNNKAKDVLKALNLLKISAKKGNMAAFSNISSMYASGDLGKKDYPKALEWKIKAADE